jgi:hypothetical protein
MIQRHQDYQLTIPLVPPGGLTDLPLKLDTDAPFALRLVKSRNLGLSGFRFETPNRQWQSSGLVTDLIPQAPGAILVNPQPSRGRIIYPEQVYPIGATIVCSVGNNTGANLTNVRLLFRGSKLFPDGAIPSPTYPAKMSVLPFTYPPSSIVIKDVPPVTTTPIRNVQLRNKTDADFVLRYGVCDPFTLGVDNGPFNPFNYTHLYVQLRDEGYKAYSNEPIHVNDLFGQGQPIPWRFEISPNANDDSVVFLPNLFTPEIYLLRDHSMYFDIYRDDPDSGPVDLHFRFQGSKVFSR